MNALDSSDPAALSPAATGHTVAIAEIRAEAAAGDEMAYPSVYSPAQTAELAARPEPLTTTEVEAIQTELALIAERRARVTDAREIAALEARARELRRLGLKSAPEQVRR
jgi:hypothetical protein